MTIKEIAIAFIILAVTFFAGRASAPASVTVEKESISKDKETNKIEVATNQQAIVTEVKYPDGKTVRRTRYIKIKEQTKSSSIETVQITAEKKEVVARRGMVASILVGTPLSWSPTLAYGVSIQSPMKLLFIPANVGAWGLFSGIKAAGISVGMEF